MLLLHQCKSQMQPQGRLRHPRVMSRGVLCRMGTLQARCEHLPLGAGLLAGSPCPALAHFFLGVHSRFLLAGGQTPLLKAVVAAPGTCCTRGCSTANPGHIPRRAQLPTRQDKGIWELLPNSGINSREQISTGASKQCLKGRDAEGFQKRS